MAFVRYCLLVIMLLALPVVRAAQIYERYALILNDPPAGEFSQSHQNAPQAVTESHSQRILAAQNSLRSELARRNLNVTGSVQTVLNAVFVRATRPHRRMRALWRQRCGENAPHAAQTRSRRRLVNAQGAWNAGRRSKQAWV
jgi:hypothetical protein